MEAATNWAKHLFGADHLSDPDFYYMLADGAAMTVQYGHKDKLCGPMIAAANANESLIQVRDMCLSFNYDYDDGPRLLPILLTTTTDLPLDLVVFMILNVYAPILPDGPIHEAGDGRNVRSWLFFRSPRPRYRYDRKSLIWITMKLNALKSLAKD